MMQEPGGPLEDPPQLLPKGPCIRWSAMSLVTSPAVSDSDGAVMGPGIWYITAPVRATSTNRQVSSQDEIECGGFDVKATCFCTT